eukprot:gene4440-4864_t
MKKLAIVCIFSIFWSQWTESLLWRVLKKSSLGYVTLSHSSSSSSCRSSKRCMYRVGKEQEEEQLSVATGGLEFSYDTVRHRLSDWHTTYQTSIHHHYLNISFTVQGLPEEGEGIKAGLLLKQMKYFASSNKAHQACKNGLVTCNGIKIFATKRLYNGDHIQISPSQQLELQQGQEEEEEEKREGEVVSHLPHTVREIERLGNFSNSLLQADRNPPLHIIYEDDDMAIVFKPAGVHSLKWINTVKRQLYCLDDVLPVLLRPPVITPNDTLARPLPCHRLDSRVCGCLVVAKTSTALDSLNRQFAERMAQKTYKAIVTGSFDFSSPFLRPITEKEGHEGSGCYLLDYPVQGRPAQTVLRLLDKTSCQVYGEMHLVELSPLTGRRHQLRIHCALLGCAILGDDLYHEAAQYPLFEQRAARIAEICSGLSDERSEDDEESSETLTGELDSDKGKAQRCNNAEMALTSFSTVRRGHGLFLMAVGLRVYHPRPSVLSHSIERKVILNNGMAEVVSVDLQEGTVTVSIDEVPRFKKTFTKAAKGAAWAMSRN